MPISYLCILISIFIPLFCAAYTKFSVKGYNNRRPREFLDNLEGKAKRAHYAQLNSYEVFAPFAAGVLVAHQIHAPDETINILSITFVCVRILYAFFYIQDMPIGRTIAWFIGFFATIGLFLIGV